MVLAGPTHLQLESTNVNLKKQVLLSTDGAGIGNPGPGGWACVLRFRSHIGEMFGCEAHTTNNRMELQAVIAGLTALKEPCTTLSPRIRSTRSVASQNGLQVGKEMVGENLLCRKNQPSVKHSTN